MIEKNIGWRPNHRLRWFVARTLCALLAAGTLGCSDDPGDDDDGDSTTTAPSTTSTTDPPATDDAAKEEVEAVVMEATAIVDELLQDPSLIDDPEDDRIGRLADLYADDSPAPGAIEDRVREMATSGEYRRPAASGVYRELVIYQWSSPTDANTLRFDTCAVIDNELVDADGDVLETESQVVYAAGEARRVDGVWRFYGLSNDVSRSMPFTPGTGTRDFCEAIASDEGAPA